MEDETTAEFFARVANETQRLVNAIGPMTPEAEGAILAMGEFMMAEFEGLVLSVEGYKPWPR